MTCSYEIIKKTFKTLKTFKNTKKSKKIWKIEQHKQTIAPGCPNVHAAAL